MSKIYDKLIKNGCSVESAEQFVYLYYYLSDEGRFWGIAESLLCLETDKLQQVIKCITHGLPYAPLLFGKLDALQMNELRRFMEDTNCISGSPYMRIVMEIASLGLDKDVIYEFRRFVKCKKPLDLGQLDVLLSFVKQYAQKSWMVLAAMNEVYQLFGFDEMMDFGKNWAANVLGYFSPAVAAAMYEAAVTWNFKKGGQDGEDGDKEV